MLVTYAHKPTHSCIYLGCRRGLWLSYQPAGSLQWCIPQATCPLWGVSSPVYQKHLIMIVKGHVKHSKLIERLHYNDKRLNMYSI